jgi:hypothetical protein
VVYASEIELFQGIRLAPVTFPLCREKKTAFCSFGLLPEGSCTYKVHNLSGISTVVESSFPSAAMSNHASSQRVRYPDNRFAFSSITL